MASHTLIPFPDELLAAKKQIREQARSYGLDFFNVIFEMCDYEQMNQIAAYGGFPQRYPHWRFGMEYEKLRKQHHYGLGRIYEMVINNDPTYAYLLESNPEVDQKLVMAHVYGHGDFFKNNFAFRHTNRKMMDEMANHATRVRRWIDRIGIEPVEDFVDRCLSLENLIDYHAPYIRRGPARLPGGGKEEEQVVRGLKTEREYMRDFINPPEFIAKQREKAKAEKEAQKRKVPRRPERDVLGFLMQHAPLEAWEADVLGIIREEAYYFLPQMQTKIMNEGWATYWHSELMTTRALRDDEVIDYAEAASGVTAMGPNQLNPYKIGVELYRDIEDRWNKGKFGKQWDECDDRQARDEWDMQLHLGQSKIFEVRRLYNDVTFIDEFFTLEFCRQNRFFTFVENRRSGKTEIESREFKKIKDTMLQQLTNFGQPFIYVVDANYLNRGELLLAHRHEGVDLRLNYARDTLRNLERIWRRPVSILTVIDDKPKRIRYDGSEILITDEPEAWKLSRG